MLLFHKRKHFWTSQRICRCISPSEEKEERIWGLIESEESHKANPSVSTLEPHRKFYYISPASHRNWNGKRDRGGCPLPLFHPLTEKTLFFTCQFFPKVWTIFRRWQFFFFRKWYPSYPSYTECPQRTNSQIRKAHKNMLFSKTNIQK